MLAVLIAIAAPALAQTAPPVGTEAAQPFKKANVVVITTSDSLSIAYKRIAAVLLGAGYTIDRADKELGFLNTKSRPAPKLNVSHALRASIQSKQVGAVIELRGSFSMPGAAAMSPLLTGETETQYRGMKGSPIMVCWDELQRVALLYPGGKLSYKQQP